MNVAGKALAGLAAIVMVTGTAERAAAQVGQAPVVYSQQMFDWNGLNIGAYQGAVFAPMATGAIAQAGVQGGYNFVFGSFVAAIRTQVGVLVAGANGAEVGVSARGGLLVAPRLLLFGDGGANWWFLTGGSAMIPWFGGGAEFAVNDRLSVSAVFRVLNLLGTTGFSTQLGINWYP